MTSTPKKTLVLGKFTHSFGLAILVAAGIAEVDFWEFLWVNALGTIAKSAILILIGFYFGQYYVQINNYINYTVYWMLAGAAVLALGYWLLVKITQKYFSK